MNLAEAADAGASVDPIVLILSSAAGGAIVTALFTLFGTWVQSRREHKRWIRERRLEAFTAAYALTKAFHLNLSKQMKIARKKGTKRTDPDIKALQAEADSLYSTAAATLAPLIILGPDEVAGYASDMQAAYEAEDWDALRVAELAFQDAARKSLGVKHRS